MRSLPSDQSPLDRLVRESRLNPDVVFGRLDEQIVLFHVRTDRIYELNGTGARLWELLAAGFSAAQIHYQMLAEFAIEPDQLEGEIAGLLTVLREQDLIGGDE